MAGPSLSRSDFVCGSMDVGNIGSGKEKGATVSGVSRADSVSPVTVCDELGHRADLAGRDDTNRLRILAFDAQDLADALLLVTRRVPDVVVRGDLARVDAEVGQPADERVGGRLENLRHERPVLRLRHLDALARAIGGLDRRLFGRRGQVARNCVEDALDADVVRRRADHDGRQDRVAHALVQAGLELGVRYFFALEVLDQHVVVGLGRRLQQLVAALGDFVGHVGRHRLLRALAAFPHICLAVDQVDIALEALRPPDGELEWRNLVSERRSQGVEGGEGLSVLTIAAGDHEDGRAAHRATQRDRPLSAGLNPARCIHRDQRAIGRREALDHLAGEVGIAGRVD